MPETKQRSVRLADETLALLQAYYPDASLTEQITTAVTALDMLRRHTLSTLRGVFAPAEWSYMADALNGTITDTTMRTNATMLMASMEDANTYDDMAHKWGVDFAAFRHKLEHLSPAQCDAVYVRVDRYWQSAHSVDMRTWAQY